MNKAISLIQMALRARQVSMGDQLISSIRSKKAKLVIISSACGENKKKKLIDKCTSFHVPYEIMEAQDFEQISDRPIQSIAILDPNFVKGIEKHMKG